MLCPNNYSTSRISKSIFSFVRIPERELPARVQQHLPHVLLRQEAEAGSEPATTAASVQRASAAAPALHRTSGQSLSVGHLPRAEDRQCRRQHRRRFVDGVVGELRHMSTLRRVPTRRFRRLATRTFPGCLEVRQSGSVRSVLHFPGFEPGPQDRTL